MSSAVALAPDRASFVAPKSFNGQITLRKSATALTDVEVQNYRLAVSKMSAISAQNIADNRGYQWFAGLHGIPQGRCKHGVAAFALWHRPYIQAFEQGLQDQVAATFVPYWNWTRDTAIPQIFLDETWTNPETGNIESNPLLAQPMNGGAPTERDPGSPADLGPNAALVAQAMLARDYDTFAPDLENPHNQVHGWVGGAMGVIGTAAYDPLFWSHHCFIEYLFCQWQDAHTSAVEPNDVTTQDLIPFGVTVDQIWNYHNLGYAYVSDAASQLTLTPGGAAASETDDELTSGSVVTWLSLRNVAESFVRAELRFEALTLPELTFELRVFAGETRADAATPVAENPNYLGSQHFFGHGGCFGAPGHCEVVERDIFDIRPKHHYAPVRIRLNVTQRLRTLIARRGPAEVPIALVAVAPDGSEIQRPGLRFEGLSLVVT